MAAVAALAVVVVGYRLIAPKPTPTPLPVVTPTYDFSSTQFGLPFSVDLPGWVRTSTLVPVSEKSEWVTWNRCPDNETECIGVSFNRNETLLQSDRYVAVSYSGYIAYLDGLAKSGAIKITERSTRQVGGRPATVMSILPLRDVPGGAGCHADTTCEDFYEGVRSRYAVIDTATVDPDGEFLAVWTRAGALAAPEVAWLSDFDAMLAALTFDRPTPSSG
jgi:hypothetical protein